MLEKLLLAVRMIVSELFIELVDWGDCKLEAIYKLIKLVSM